MIGKNEGKKWKVWVALALLLPALFSFSPSKHGSLKQKADNPFAKFEKKLRKAARNQDRELLAQLLHDSIADSPDGCGYAGCPKEEFLREYFRLGDSSSESDWETLQMVLENGFTPTSFEDKNLDSPEGWVAPKGLLKYRYSDSLQILKPQTPVLDRPISNANVLATINNGVFHCNCCKSPQFLEGSFVWEGETCWVHLEFQSGKWGYVDVQNTDKIYFRQLMVGMVKGEWKVIGWFLGEGC